MAYSQLVLSRIANRAGYRCEMCSRRVDKVQKGQKYLNFHGHSVTTLHLTQLRNNPGMVIATSVPSSLSRIKGHLFRIDAFEVFQIQRQFLGDIDPNDKDWNLLDDGFFLCDNCHRGIHEISFNETRLIIPDATFKNPILTELQRISLDLILHRKRF